MILEYDTFCFYFVFYLMSIFLLRYQIDTHISRYSCFDKGPRGAGGPPPGGGNFPPRPVLRDGFFGVILTRALGHRPPPGPPPGIGTPSGDGEVPTITLRWSKDHGHTWSQGLTIELGRAGDYTHRLLWRKLGRARDWQFEVVCDAPVPLTLLGAFANTGSKSLV